MSSSPLPLQEPLKLRSLPVQWIGAAEGVILVRGCTEIRIDGDRAADAARVVLQATAGEGCTHEEVRELFAAPDQPAIDQLIEELLSRRILLRGVGNAPVLERETALDVFYWHFEDTAELVTERLNSKRIAVVGVNAISRQLVSSLREMGVSSVTLVDHEMLRNVRLFDDQGKLRPEGWPAALPQPESYEAWGDAVEPESLDCIVATSDFGGAHLMRLWNALCVEKGRWFLPVVLSRMVGAIGPLVIPRETACYECLRAREDACANDPAQHRLTEPSAYHRQEVNGFHPAMAAVLGELCALELTKIFGGAIPFRAGVQITVNLLKAEMRSHRILKIPRCPVCSPALFRSDVNLNNSSFVPGNVDSFHGPK